MKKNLSRYVYLLEKSKGLCALCQRPLSLTVMEEVIRLKLQFHVPDERFYRKLLRDSDVDIDHIQPVSMGGGDGLDNLQLAHKKCNSSKGNGKQPGAGEWMKKGKSPVVGAVNRPYRRKRKHYREMSIPELKVFTASQSSRQSPELVLPSDFFSRIVQTLRHIYQRL